MDYRRSSVMKATRRLDIDAHRIRALETELVELRERNAVLERQHRDDEPRRIEERAQTVRLIMAAREIHRALYTDNIHRLVLETAIGVTSAQRGCFLRWMHGDMEVAAAINVDGGAGDPPSPFMSAIADRVRARGTPIRWAEREAAFGVDAARGDAFTNGVAAPVLLHGQVAGVILLLDRVRGAFDANDEDNLLVLGGEASVALQNARLRDEIHGAFVTTLALLADLVEAKDPYTAGHCERVSRYARATARRLQLSDAQQQVACYAALLHDIGKIGISDDILHKAGPLTAQERARMQEHVRIGNALLGKVPLLREVADVVLRHHEWYDGRGYPDGVAGDAIPIEARVVSVVDAYVAMLDKRSYKPPCSIEDARAELHRSAGTQFDPRVVEAALEAIEAVDAGGADADECGPLPGLLARRLLEVQLP
jgi:putative nucleotidyltransferase with HDIG domain